VSDITTDTYLIPYQSISSKKIASLSPAIPMLRFPMTNFLGDLAQSYFESFLPYAATNQSYFERFPP
jgi:hypothetical protein